MASDESTVTYVPSSGSEDEGERELPAWVLRFVEEFLLRQATEAQAEELPSPADWLYRQQEVIEVSSTEETDETDEIETISVSSESESEVEARPIAVVHPQPPPDSDYSDTDYSSGGWMWTSDSD